MQLVYQLLIEHKQNPKMVSIAQSLTLNSSKPYLGLKGSCGLYGSPEWWNNIKTGKLKTQLVSGVIESVYYAGQDSDTEPNMFELLLNDGTKHSESIVTNIPSDRAHFKPGRQVTILYVYDELKVQTSDGKPQYSEIMLEMSIAQHSN